MWKGMFGSIVLLPQGLLLPLAQARRAQGQQPPGSGMIRALWRYSCGVEVPQQAADSGISATNLGQ